MAGITFIDSRKFKGIVAQTDEAVQDGGLDGTYGVRKYFVAEKMETKSADDRTVNIVISTKAIDRDNDTIDPEGFHLDNYRKNPVVLFAHDNTQPPIGRADSIESKNGKLSAVTRFMPADLSPFSDTIFRMIGAKFLNAASVGFLPLEYSQVKRDGSSGRAGEGIDFTKQELLEYSIVPVPSNPEALVGAKSAGIDTRHLLDWYEKALADWANHRGMLLVPKSLVEKLVTSVGTKKIFVPPPDVQDDILARNLKAVKQGDATLNQARELTFSVPPEELHEVFVEPQPEASVETELTQGALGADEVHDLVLGSSNLPPATITAEEFDVQLGSVEKGVKPGSKPVVKHARVLPHLADRVFNRPLIMEPGRLASLLSVLGDRINIDDASIEKMFGKAGMWSDDEDEDRPRKKAKQYIVTREGVAIVPVHGTLVQRNGGSLHYCGFCGYDGLSKVFDETLADPDVKAIAFEFDSPGGEVAGCFPLADKIYKARGQKPMWALVNESAYSAAYALASACDHIVVPRTGGVGSVGVVTIHADYSKRYDAAGMKFTLIHAGDKKVDGNHFNPLPEGVKSDIQKDIDAMYDIFVKMVARNRNLDEAVVRGTQAGLISGYESDNKGFFDESLEYEEAIEKMASTFQVKKDPEPVQPVPAKNADIHTHAEVDLSNPEIRQMIGKVVKDSLAGFMASAVDRAIAKRRGRVG
jgi:capsid assembly protease